jgi:hypothetical protein
VITQRLPPNGKNFTKRSAVAAGTERLYSQKRIRLLILRIFEINKDLLPKEGRENEKNV